MNHQKIIQELEHAEDEWIAEMSTEILSGNIVKHEYAKGVVAGLRIALGELRRSAEASNTRSSATPEKNV